MRCSMRGLTIAVAGVLLLAADVSPGHVGPWSAAQAQAPDRAGAHAIFNELLGRYVVASADGVNRVDYGRWKASAADRSRLESYIGNLLAQAPSKQPRAEAFAYWSNLYNAVTLKVVLDRYPVRTIREIKSESLLDPKAYLGPWRTRRVTVEGRSYSLDDIEHEVLRPSFKDPRVHYALNCASYGCPNLRAKAWAAATLDADLDAAAREYINHPRGVTVLSGGRLRVSSIYKWFKDDFGGNDAGVIDHIRKYSDPKLARALRADAVIGEDAYDWSLNDAKVASTR